MEKLIKNSEKRKCLYLSFICVRETQAIMEKTGLLMGTEMYTWMLLAAARSKDWNRVIEALIALI